jgi:hypothetical protein
MIDIRDMKEKNQKKEIFVYITFMLMVGIFGIFYLSNPDRESFSEILLSFIGQEG